MRRLLLLSPALLMACKPRPPDAPKELDDLVGYLYAHAPDEEPDALEVGAVNLDAWIVDRIDETLAGYVVQNLSDETVDALGEGDRDLEDLAGAAVGYESLQTVEDLVGATLRDDPMEMDPVTVATYEQEEREGTVACFLDGDCERLETEVWTTQNFALGITVGTHSIVQYRWVDTPDGRAMLQRNWLREAAEVNFEWLEVDQQYYLWMVLPEDGAARSMQATWVVARMAGDEVPEDTALNLVIDSMVNKAENLDAWVAGGR